MKLALFIGCGELETGQIELARELGLGVAVTDRNPKAKAFKFADFTACLDANDIPGIVSFALDLAARHTISAIYSGTEAYLTVSVAGRILGLGELPLKGAAICQNKRLMKEVWLEKGVKTPGYLNGRGGRCVLKPEASSSGRGVKILDSPQPVPQGFIAEEFISGTHHDVNGLFKHGNFFPAGMTDRIFLPDSPVQDLSRAPTSLSPELQRRAYDLLEQACLALGLYHGPVKADIVYDGRDFWVLEVGPRFHGDLSTLHMTPRATGIEALRAWFLLCLGDDNWLRFLEPRFDKVALAKSISKPNPQSNDDIERFVVVVADTEDDAREKLTGVLAGQQGMAALDIRRNYATL